ncbi:DUF1131 family protein [Acuticoccus sp.]|uniref:DUF1131 family protein n=1 Tax=Acuticoccus sp. TaxID=1904378 RepID=UPI003B515CC2
MARLTVLLLSLALASCGSGAVEPPSEDRVSVTTWLVMTDDGVGEVAHGTPYRGAALAGVAPGAEVRSIETAKEDATAWTHAAFVGEVQAVQFFEGRDGTVAEMHGVAQHLAGPNGERIGMTMRQAGVGRRDCRNGRRLWRGMAVCRARGSKNIELVFAIPQYDGPFDRLASAEDLERAELQRIVWRPNA